MGYSADFRAWAVCFVFDTAGGVLFAKFLNLFLKKKVNPMIGAADFGIPDVRKGRA